MVNTLGYIRVAAASPEVKPGDVDFNINKIFELADKAEKEETGIIVFPELSVTGYTCADLFYQSNLLNAALKGLYALADKTKEFKEVIVVGAPLQYGASLYNCAVVLYKGAIIGAIPKKHLPNYNEFYERRWFQEADSLKKLDPSAYQSTEIPVLTDKIIAINGVTIGIEICEDLWVPVPPSSKMAAAGANIILNLSASNEVIGKHNYLVKLIANQSARCRCAYVYASAGPGESSTDLVFSGNCIIAENGNILAESPRFELGSKLEIRDIDVEMLENDRRKFATFAETDSSDYSVLSVDSCDNERHRLSLGVPLDIKRTISPTPFISQDEEALNAACAEISSIQAWGLAQRLRAIHCSNAVIGISGGLDSTLALLVVIRAFDMLGLDRKGIVAITMPGFGTTTRTKTNATLLMELTGVTMEEISINDAVKQHFKDIGHDPSVRDATYENSQARERTQILMDMANKTGGIVIGTGDLSELALGWCTYNGDQMSMYGVNASIPKTLVRYLVRWYADTASDPKVRDVLYDIIDTPISPELLPASEDGSIEQKTEDLVGPYELHDFFLHSMLRNNFSPTKIYYLACHAFEGKYSPDVIKHWLKTFYRRFFSQQFKRSCMPDGVKVGSVTLSPRGDWRMPSDASANLWLNEVESL